MKRVVVVTHDNGGDREDGNVYYSDYFLVTAPAGTGLAFKEPIFSDPDGFLKGMLEGNFQTIMQKIGYTVESLDPLYLLRRA